MFFTASHFYPYVDQQTAENVAKQANAIIAEQGITVYGHQYLSGNVKDFTSLYKAGDTHVGIIIGVAEIGAFKAPSDPQLIKAPPVAAEPRPSDLQSRLDAMEKELKALRQGSNQPQVWGPRV